MSAIIKVEELTKTYGTTIAVNKISFDVQEGEMVVMGVQNQPGTNDSQTSGRVGVPLSAPTIVSARINVPQMTRMST